MWGAVTIRQVEGVKPIKTTTPAGSAVTRRRALNRTTDRRLELPGTAGVWRHESTVFRVLMAAVALYVVDDNFVHPEPGTSARDHLLSGLVPLAILLALALTYPRLRPGLRAAVALACGPLALTAGVVDGIHHITVDSMSGDDFTALLAALAGVLLLALGAASLWRSRRRDGSRTRRYARRALIGVAGLIVAYLVILPIGLAIVVTHKTRAPVHAQNLGRPYERVSFRTSDGLRLTGWYVASHNRAAVIVFPGRSAGTATHARVLVGHGYGVLLFDRRGEGQSQGDYNARGWNGEKDLNAALAFLRNRPDIDPQRIGGLGLSVGGELLLETAANNPALRAVVSEGAGRRSMAEQLEWPGIPRWQRWISPMLVETGATAILSNSGPPPDLADLMPRIAPRPVFLISALHGNADEVLNRVYYAAARTPKTLWEVPQGGHTHALSALPREYERRVIAFFDQALLGGSSAGR